MPWISNVSAVMAAWYPGIGGGEAIADLLFGRADPSGKLPITFAKSDTELPDPVIAGWAERHRSSDNRGPRKAASVDLHYKEGLAVGYRWYQVNNRKPLFAFGHGLSYTTFQYSALQVDAQSRTVQFVVTNTGKMPGVEIAQLYVRLPQASQEPFKRLAGWERIQLAPGESHTVTLKLNPAWISVFDEKADRWQLLAGDYGIEVGGGSDAISLKNTSRLAE
jgi:beta-glucosidase